MIRAWWAANEELRAQKKMAEMSVKLGVLPKGNLFSSLNLSDNAGNRLQGDALMATVMKHGQSGMAGLFAKRAREVLDRLPIHPAVVHEVPGPDPRSPLQTSRRIHTLFT